MSDDTRAGIVAGLLRAEAKASARLDGETWSVQSDVMPPMSVRAKLRRLDKHRARLGAGREPIELPELDELWPVPVLPGETPPHVPGEPLRTLYYGPDGEPLNGTFTEVMDQWGAARRRADSHWLSPTFYRAGTLLQVSTVYLGLDHGFGGGPPLIWESMVFHGGRPGQLGAGVQQWRYSTRAAARAGHVAIVTAIRDAQRARRAAWHQPRPARLAAYARPGEATP